MKTCIRLLTLMWLWALPHAHALTITPEALATALASADLEAEIRVVAKTSQLTEEGITLTLVDAVVESTPVGNGRSKNSRLPTLGQTISLQVLGGEHEGLGTFLTGYPRPHLGQSYRARLKEISPGLFEIVGFEAGFVPLRPRRGYSRNRTDGSNGEGNGAFLYWDDSYFPVPYYISSPSFRGFSAFLTAIDRSFQTWVDAASTKIDFMALGCSSITKNANDGVNNIIYVRENWPFNADAIAITRNFYVADESAHAGAILDSDILLNGQHHRFTVNGETGSHDIQNILTHEIGHFLGLGHERAPKETEAVMYEVASTNETKKRTLHANDLAAIQEGYLGVPKKIGRTQSVCSVDNENLGCLSVHPRPTTRLPFAAWWFFGGLLVVLMTGRKRFNFQ